MALWQRWQALRRAIQPLRPLGSALLHNEEEAARQQAAMVAQEMGRGQAGMEVFDRCAHAP